MKHLYIALLASAALTTACSDYNDQFEGLKEGHHAVDIKKKDYILTADDYKAIAENPANKALAKKNGEADELAALAKTQRFTEKITSEEYLPAFLAKKWFTADNGSAITIIYNDGKKLYELKDNKWMTDPSTTMNLTDISDRGIRDFLDAAVRWVKANKGEKYIDPTDNSREYYSGVQSKVIDGSFYVIDLRVSEAKRVVPELAKMTDEEIKKQLLNNLYETFAGALSMTYPEATPSQYYNVVYTLIFLSYTGEREYTAHEVKFKVIGKGKFEPIAKSLKEVK